jgi:outer membrane protein assembly factor BamB
VIRPTPLDEDKTMPWVRSTILVLALAGVAHAEDWPQWLGPRRDGSTTAKIAPWKKALKIVWQQPVGEGNSSPVVAGGKVFLHAKKKGVYEESLQAFAAKDGKPLWTQTYPRAKVDFVFGNGPRATPAIVGDRLYSFGITGVLSCYDLKEKLRLWQVDTQKEFKAPRLFFGASCSPLVDGDAVQVNVGAKGASIVAFAKESGDVLWKKLDDGASYSSPIAFGQGGERQAVFLTAEGVASLSPKDGRVFWQFPFKDKASESSSTPVHAGNLLIASAITKGSIGLPLENDGQGPKVGKPWHNAALTCYFSTPVLVGEQLYFVTGSHKPPQILGETVLRCVELKTGKQLWQGPRVGTFHASLMRTGDNKLLLLEEGGNLVLVEPDPKGYKELARSKICGSTWSHAAISEGRLYVRDAKELVCVELT